jgi:hypothetical protein
VLVRILVEPFLGVQPRIRGWRRASVLFAKESAMRVIGNGVLLFAIGALGSAGPAAGSSRRAVSIT